MDKIILSPGPTQCKSEFLDVLSQPLMYHRCSDFHQIYDSCRAKLKKIVSLDSGEVILLTSSGTGAMEASVSNLCNPGDHVLVISIGHFGNRFIDICNQYNLNVSSLKYELGSSYDYEQVADFIANNQDLKAVFITHHETSSGVLNNLEPIGKLVSNLPDCMFVVDSISGLLAHPMQMSGWNIDCLLAGSQKGFLIPPGLAIAALSDKAIARLECVESCQYYFDFKRYLDMLDVSETPFTPCIPLIVALDKACDYLLDEVGLDNYCKHHKDLREYLEQKLQDRGLDVDFVDRQDRGNVLVAIKVKDGWNAKDIHDELDKQGYIVATGFGDLKPKMLRIGVIGYIDKDTIDKFLVSFDEVIKRLYG